MFSFLVTVLLEDLGVALKRTSESGREQDHRPQGSDTQIVKVILAVGFQHLPLYNQGKESAEPTTAPPQIFS